MNLIMHKFIRFSINILFRSFLVSFIRLWRAFRSARKNQFKPPSNRIDKECNLGGDICFRNYLLANHKWNVNADELPLWENYSCLIRVGLSTVFGFRIVSCFNTLPISSKHQLSVTHDSTFFFPLNLFLLILTALFLELPHF